MAEAEAEAALQAQIATAAVALAANVTVTLPDFWVKDPKIWFSQAEAQFCRARITREAPESPGRRQNTTMFFVELPEEVVMSVKSLVTEIEANPALEDTSYQLLNAALIGSYGKTLLDHPTSGTAAPPMMAEMLSLRFEKSAPTHCSSSFSSVDCCPPFETTSPTRTTKRRRKWQHTRMFCRTPETPLLSQQSQTLWPPSQFAPLCPVAAALWSTAPATASSLSAAQRRAARTTGPRTPTVGCVSTTTLWDQGSQVHGPCSWQEN